MKLNFLLTAALTALVEEIAGVLDDVEVGLFTNSPDLNDPELVLADITAATFNTYAPVTIPFDDWSIVADADGVPYASTAPLQFQAVTNAALPQTINGVYYYKGTDLLAVAYLETPITLSHALQTLHITPTISFTKDDLITQEGHGS